MYAWLWRRLPGGLPGKLFGCAVLLVAAVLLLFTVVFPQVSPHLPFNHVTVDTPAGSPSPSPTGSGAVPN